MKHLDKTQREKLEALLIALIDQENARVLVEPNRRESGFWFGGGNLAEDVDGTLWIAGRYRNFGDSRTGLAAGERGLECALFMSEDKGQTFTKDLSWTKKDLSRPDAEVLSIEGTSLHRRSDGDWELFISSEKSWDYPEELTKYLKPGAGVWSIDVMSGPSIRDISTGTLSQALREEEDGGHLHVKDPVVYDAADGSTHMIFCSHPHCWTCSNSGLAIRAAGEEDFHLATHQFVHRGPAWDVAGTRITCRMPVPKLGVFADSPDLSVYLYDGLECVREHEENRAAVRRPRGYSCEEIGGALVGVDDDFPETERLSYLFPLFVSPWGTGCSRYTDVLILEDGIFACWQQSQKDYSQPLVGNFLPMEQVESILS